MTDREPDHIIRLNADEVIEVRNGTNEGGTFGVWPRCQACHKSLDIPDGSAIPTFCDSCEPTEAERADRQARYRLEAALEQGEIIDELVEQFTPMIEGRTIVKFERATDSDDRWSDGCNTVHLTLDDGAVLRFEGWGYDASGLSTYYTEPPSTGPTEPIKETP